MRTRGQNPKESRPFTSSCLSINVMAPSLVSDFLTQPVLPSSHTQHSLSHPSTTSKWEDIELGFI